jgi:multiple sugar transport system substrate-binding protein
MKTTSRSARLRVALAATAVLPLIALTACSSGGSSGGAVTADTGTSGAKLSLTALDYYTDEPAHGDTQKRLSACAAKVNATITQQSVPSPQYNAKVLQAISTKTLPDVLMVNNPDLPQFAKSGALNDLANLKVDTSAYMPSVLGAGKYDGKLYGLAPNVNTLVLFYNKKMLSDAGVEVPKTWADLEAAAKKLTTKDRYGFAYSAAAGTEGEWTFVPFLWSNGGSQADLTSAKSKEALTYYTGLALKGYVSKSAVNWSQADAKDQFAAGKAAMMINGPWQIPALKQVKGLDWASTTIPVPKAGVKPAAPLGGELWTVPRTTPERQARAASIVQCLNAPDTQLTMALSNNTVPSNSDAATQLASKEPDMASIVETVRSARALTSDAGDKWPDVDTSLSAAIQAVITGQSSVDDAMAKAQQQAFGK